MGSVRARLSDRLLRSSSACRPRVISSVPMSAGTRGSAGAAWGVTVPHRSLLTLGHFVQQHRDLLILQQPALEEGDKDAIGELILAQFVGFGICTPAGTGQQSAPSWAPSLPQELAIPGQEPLGIQSRVPTALPAPIDPSSRCARDTWELQPDPGCLKCQPRPLCSRGASSVAESRTAPRASPRPVRDRGCRSPTTQSTDPAGTWGRRHRCQQG